MKFRKVSIHRLSNDFKEAAEIVTASVEELENVMKDGDILVKAAYFGINASDVNFSAGRYDPTLKPPFDAGFEAIGTVVKSTPIAETIGFKVGRSVGKMKFGAFAEYFLVSAKSAIPLPSTDPIFFGAMVSGLTAALSLVNQVKIESGKSILITAAAGGAGQLAVQIAKMHGLRVFGTCSSPEKAKLLQSLGCDRAINYKTENVKQVVMEETHGRGVDYCFESVGGQLYQDCISCLTVRGHLVVIGSITYYAEKTDSSKGGIDWSDTVATSTLLKRSLSVSGFFLNHYGSDIPKVAADLIQWIASNRLKVTVDADFHGIDDIKRAVKYLHSGKNIGKVVVRVDKETHKL